MDTNEIEVKSFGGRVVEYKEEDRNGVKIGIIAGYLATWDKDEGGRYGVPERFHKGAFLKSLEEHRQRGMRQVRFKDFHGRTIGGFPIESMKEDDVGLYGRGEVNLETQLGREAYALARQDVLVDFSVGYTATDDKIVDEVREIFEAILWEGSIIDEPMNRRAQVLEVKAVVPFQNLPLADPDRRWDASAAKKRITAFTGSDESPSAAYKKAFLWYDREEKDEFGAYKLPIADVVGGQLVAVPKAIFAAAGALRGARGGVEIPDADRKGVVRHVEKYYSKMDQESPFKGGKHALDVEEVKSLTVRELEDVLVESGCFSKSAATLLAGLVSRGDQEEKASYSRTLKQIQGDLETARDLVR